MFQGKAVIPPDDNVIVHGNADCLAYLDNGFRHVDIGARWSRITGRVIVRQHQSRSVLLQSPLDQFARVNRRMVDCAAVQDFIGNEPIPLNCSTGSKAMAE